MRLVFLMIASFVIAIAMGILIRNTPYMKAREKRIYEYFCKKTGGQDLIIESIWSVRCIYAVDKSGQIIRP